MSEVSAGRQRDHRPGLFRCGSEDESRAAHPLFSYTGMGHGNIADHLHIYRPVDTWIAPIAGGCSRSPAEVE